MSTDFTNMGRGVSQSKFLYTFIHNVYADFFSDLMDYLGDYLYPRFEHQVMGTFDKAVEYLTKGTQYNREVDMPMKSALIMNPTGEFSIAEGNAGGKMLWRFPNLAPGLARRLFAPVYQDEHVKVSPGFMRVKGEVELIMLLDSFYEYCDLRMFLFNIFGGLERPIEPQFFTSFIILGSDLLNYEYYNPITGVRYKLDWDSAGAYETLVKTTAQTEIVIPVKIKPQIMLASISDASTRYGGPDNLPDWRLNATLNYEVELPTFMILESDYLAENIKLEVRYGSAYSKYDLTTPPPLNMQIFDCGWTWDVDETSSSDISLDSTSSASGFLDLIFKTRYYYQITQADIDSTSSVISISMPEPILDNRYLIVWSYDGEMSYKDHYTLSNDGNTLSIIKENVTLSVGVFIELFVYGDVG